MAEGDEAREIITHAVNRARAQPPHQSDKTVFTANLRRPTIQVAAECHPGGVRHQVITILVAFHQLDEQRHAFIVIQQPLTAAVQQCVGVERGGVDLGNGPGKHFEVLR